MGNRSQWPYVADNSWGILTNYYPLALLPESQRAAVLANPAHKRAIVEIPYSDIAWSGSQGHVSYIESYGYTTPHLLILNESHQNSMMTREEILAAKARFPGKKIIMNTRRWVDDHSHVESVADVVDGVCIEYIPTNVASEINKHVSPFFEWAHNNNKIIYFLMPPQPDDSQGTRYVDGVKLAAQTIYNYNKNRLPKGWMKSNRIFFIPANYTFGASLIPCVSETSPNSILASAKALMDMRAQLDAVSDIAESDNAWLSPIFLLLE